MTTDVSDDLLPLFVSEARERLERLHVLAVPGWSETAKKEARRELHTLKGSSRMMALKDLSELCHVAEGAVSGTGSEDLRKVMRCLDQINAAIDRLEADRDGNKKKDRPPKTSPPGTRETRETDAKDDGVVRVGLKTLDTLTDNAIRMQLVSRQAVATVDVILSLARAAEVGIAQDDPKQVLAGLASRLRATAIGADRAQRRFHQMADSNLETLSTLQVQPVQPLLQGLARHARELASSLGKAVDVVAYPSKCRLDRRIAEALKETMLHLVRNAVDHGIESSSARRAAGKTERGTIELRAEANADRVHLEVSDDGGGVDTEKVLAAAVCKGILQPEEGSQDPESIIRILFRPGFSTLDHTTEVSGRGVGLDAVETAVRRVGGSISLNSELGRGTRITIDLPSKKRGERIVVVEIGGMKSAVIASNVSGYRAAPHSQNGDVFEGAVNLSRTIGRRKTQPRAVVTLDGPGMPTGVLVDRVCGEEEVLIRSWPACVGEVPPFEGFALLSSGEPVTILDASLIDEAARASEQSGLTQTEPSRSSPIKVLLVDDSRITREMLRRLLRESGFEVFVASSGAEALQRLEMSAVDCVVTDIEMPGTDGLELTRHIRADDDLAQLPVIVVSTRDQAVDRLAGLDAGADAYLTKQRLDARELAALVRRLGRTD